LQAHNAPSAPILLLTGIRRSYNVGTEVETEVLHGISIALQQAEFAALKGRRGRAKARC
jgi:lipoprotein-releasing system ATP-binding protein